MTYLSPNSTASQALSLLGATYSMNLDVEYISGALQCVVIDQKLWQLNEHSRPAGSFSSTDIAAVIHELPTCHRIRNRNTENWLQLKATGSGDLLGTVWMQ